MARKEQASKAAVCVCGGHEFKISGAVAYARKYDSRSDNWSTSMIEWERDYPLAAQCAGCERDAKSLIARSGSLSGFYEIVAADATRPKKNQYLVDFEFVSGEFGQPFSHVFEARQQEELERRVEKYLDNYYEGGSRREGRTWFYLDDQVAVKLCGWSEITDLNELLRGLRV